MMAYLASLGALCTVCLLVGLAVSSTTAACLSVPQEPSAKSTPSPHAEPSPPSNHIPKPSQLATEDSSTPTPAGLLSTWTPGNQSLNPYRKVRKSVTELAESIPDPCSVVHRVRIPNVNPQMRSRLERVLDLDHDSHTADDRRGSVQKTVVGSLASTVTGTVSVGPGFGWNWSMLANALETPESAFLSLSCTEPNVVQSCQPMNTGTRANQSRAATVAVVGGDHPGPNTIKLSRNLKRLGAAAIFFFPLHLVLALEAGIKPLVRALVDDGHTVGLRIETAPLSTAAIHSAVQLYRHIRDTNDAALPTTLHLYIPPYALYPSGISDYLHRMLELYGILLVLPNWMLEESALIGQTVGTSDLVRMSVSKRVDLSTGNALGPDPSNRGWILGVSGGTEDEMELVEAAIVKLKETGAAVFAKDPIQGCFPSSGAGNTFDQLPPSLASSPARGSEGGTPDLLESSTTAQLPCPQDACWHVGVEDNRVSGSMLDESALHDLWFSVL